MLVHNISVPFFGKYKPKKQRPGGGIPPSGQTKYFYDTAGQLVRENNETAGTTTLWTYDRAGNILTEKVYDYTTGTPSVLREDNNYIYTSTKWGDLLTAYNGNMIYYDNTTTLGDFKIGNPTTYDNGTHWTFTWEHGRQLATMQTGATTWTNTYNSDGLRTSRTNGTITYNYYYDGSQLTSVTGSNGNVWIFYDGNRPVIIKYGDTATYHYELNLQGDVIAILDSSGNRVVEYTYDAWGKILSISGSKKDDLGQANPLRYRGYVYDNETQLYYLQSRYYDPETGRFLNADAFAATGQGMLGNNLFAYCSNNPVMYADSTGTLSARAYKELRMEKHKNIPHKHVTPYTHHNGLFAWCFRRLSLWSEQCTCEICGARIMPPKALLWYVPIMLFLYPSVVLFSVVAIHSFCKFSAAVFIASAFGIFMAAILLIMIPTKIFISGTWVSLDQSNEGWYIIPPIRNKWIADIIFAGSVILGFFFAWYVTWPLTMKIIG